MIYYEQHCLQLCPKEAEPIATHHQKLGTGSLVNRANCTCLDKHCLNSMLISTVFHTLIGQAVGTLFIGSEYRSVPELNLKRIGPHLDSNIKFQRSRAYAAFVNAEFAAECQPTWWPSGQRSCLQISMFRFGTHRGLGLKRFRAIIIFFFTLVFFYN